VRRIRDALYKAVVVSANLKPEDVEVKLRVLDKDNINSGALAIEIDSGPGKRNRRVIMRRTILLALNDAIVGIVPAKFCKKGESNLWLRFFLKGISMPIGCPELIH
jgi:translation elongation factor EF-1alpha